MFFSVFQNGPRGYSYLGPPSCVRDCHAPRHHHNLGRTPDTAADATFQQELIQASCPCLALAVASELSQSCRCHLSTRIDSRAPFCVLRTLMVSKWQRLIGLTASHMIPASTYLELRKWLIGGSTLACVGGCWSSGSWHAGVGYGRNSRLEQFCQQGALTHDAIQGEGVLQKMRTDNVLPLHAHGHPSGPGRRRAGRSREFTKGGLVKGFSNLVYVLKTSQIAKPPFTKHPVVNSRRSAVPAHGFGACRGADRPGGVARSPSCSSGKRGGAIRCAAAASAALPEYYNSRQHVPIADAPTQQQRPCRYIL